jgi:hypothetical protein
MAKADDERSTRSIDKKLDNLDDNVEKLYQSTYQSRMDDKKDLDSIMNDIDTSMDSIISKINDRSIADISSLYTRLQSKNKVDSDKYQKSMEEAFDTNKQLMDTINTENIRKAIQAEDYQYDMICRYMPKLEDAIDIKKDNVLSSDNFTKEFVNIKSDKSSKEYIQQFNDKATAVKKKYRVQDLFEDMYYKAAKYGEYFLYHVPYQKAFERLLQRKGQLSNGGVKYESSTIEDFEENSPNMIFESTNFNGDMKDCGKLDESFTKAITDGDVKVNLIFDESGIIPEPIAELKQAMQVKNKHLSVTESYLVEKGEEGTTVNTLKMDDSAEASDGLVTTDKDIKINDKIAGSVLYEVPRAEIFPLAMQNTVIGYLHLQVANNYIDNMVLNGYSYNSLTNNTELMADEYDKQNDMFVNYISSMISDKIDAKFINSNLDLKEQIFAVLRYNDHFCTTNGINSITVSFIPAEDIHHFYFKLNEKTHRGISDLNKAVVPAMIYCLLYLNTVIGQMSRSQDKRVYYVKQNVETNVARTLLNVIEQLKKGNMGMRQLENMNTIFNVIGRFNDHVIPMSQSGDPPIQMEVLQGQQIDTPNELMDRMEDSAVSSTDVPLEFVQSTNAVDYATRFTMSNSKFLRKVYKRQRICQEHFTEIFRKLYNYEYGDNDQTMEVLLPAPAFLAMTNSQQLIDNVKNYANAIADITCADKDDTVKTEFINICVRNFLGTYIDFNNIDSMISSAEHNVKVRPPEGGDEGGDNGGY